ncbi:hypothetical protein [Eggerthella sinensis]|uniref:Lipoprotein n=1 Tax=Eggerthella sinensis TaxID=242230 RepID=A0A3N0IUT6_9ACTN|nr:hypothetical protein [Eggerthella sinensis]RDB62190.1 hypothetical protein C1876_17220 [Eggerthella sinensis]RNM40761.1 hypothetical protein DMP09_12900 [Eggerthella sinensis]
MRLPVVRGARTAVLTAALVAVVSLAGCATTSEPAADTGKEADAPVEQPTEEASSLAERTIDTPYYTVVVPESWRGVLAYEYGDTYTIDEQSKGTDAELGIGYTTTIRNTETDESFSVTMYTDAWGPQGQFMSEKAGSSTVMPGNYVAVVKQLPEPFNGWGSIPQDEQDAMLAQMEEYASWVTVK